MKNLISLIFFCFTIAIVGQNKYLTKTGTITFEASVPSFEEVSSINKNVTAIIDTDTGNIAALALVKGFRFKNALMEEHFNENYAESSKYPKATFKGKIKDFDVNNINSSYIISGELTFHGVSRKFDSIEVNLTQQDSVINLSGKMKANPADYNIKIPSIVRNKIAENVEISFSFRLEKK